jgi:hypothetical protein
MRLEAKKYLYDMQQGASLLAEFVAGRTFADYQANAMLRAAVERQFEIIGEALSKLARLDADLAARVSEHRRDHRLPQHPHSRLRRCGPSAGVGHRRDEAARPAQ